MIVTDKFTNIASYYKSILSFFSWFINFALIFTVIFILIWSPHHSFILILNDHCHILSLYSYCLKYYTQIHVLLSWPINQSTSSSCHISYFNQSIKQYRTTYLFNFYFNKLPYSCKSNYQENHLWDSSFCMSWLVNNEIQLPVYCYVHCAFLITFNQSINLTIYGLWFPFILVYYPNILEPCLESLWTINIFTPVQRKTECRLTLVIIKIP